MQKAIPLTFLLAAVVLAPSWAPARPSQGTGAPRPTLVPPPAAVQQPQRPSAPASAPAAPAPAAALQKTGLSVVVIDPAHGGSDSGARGPTGASESDIVVDFARALRVALEAQGLRVLLTREGNQNPSFDDRSALVNGLRDAVFISLHVSSTGPLGTARAYALLPFPAQAAARAASAPPRPGLLQWDRAQVPYLSASRQLAELLQVQLGQKFKGSPEVPAAAAVRQLRTIAAPAVAVEVSSVASEPQKLAQMGQPLAEAISRAVADFRPLAAAAPAGGGR